jgi:5-methylcytosine-specific restriction endonuclease McrA
MALGRCLVLNNSYEYLDVADWFEAICLLVEGKATPLAEYNDVVRSQYETWKVPSVLLMKYYVKTRKRKNTFGVVNKRNILVRDDFKCQFCGSTLSMRNGTIDHVHPRSRGGTHSLDNCVASCKTCNNAKGDMLLSDFERKTNMKLKTEPRQLTEAEKIDCLLKTVKSKERNAWLDCLDNNGINLY